MGLNICYLRRVEKLDISINYYSEGTFKNNELYNSSPYLVKINAKKDMLYGEKIVVELNEALTGGELIIGSRRIKFKLNEWLKQHDFDINVYLNPKIKISQIKKIFENNKGFYFVVSDVDAVTGILQSKIDIRMLNEAAKTILIKVRDVNAAKSTDVVNAIMEEFLTYDVERKSESSRNILAFIEDQLSNVYNSLKSTENELQEFKREKKL